MRKRLTGMAVRLIESIKSHEGRRLEAYQDHLGVWTIGYGTNLQVLKIDEELAERWLVERVTDLKRSLSGVDGFDRCNDVRQDVLTEMAYQLGLRGCLRFKKMWAAIRGEDWQRAAEEMLESRWARQTPRRAMTLSNRMSRGQWDDA